MVDLEAPLQRQITLSEEESAEVPASCAVLCLTVTGARLFAGNAALKEAAEVRRLIDALTVAGAAADDVTLEGVSIDTSKGIIGKSSAATYRLRARCTELALLPSFLDAVAAQKSCHLSSVDWRYDGAETILAECLRRCVKKALSKARIIAETLGVELDGVVGVRDTSAVDLAPVTRGVSAPPGMMRARSTIADQIGGLELAPRHPVRASVLVTFAIRRS